ncbi:hypothetical protein HK104_000401, partial [Borealophlyctis nickersoniae]
TPTPSVTSTPSLSSSPATTTTTTTTTTTSSSPSSPKRVRFHENVLVVPYIPQDPLEDPDFEAFASSVGGKATHLWKRVRKVVKNSVGGISISTKAASGDVGEDGAAKDAAVSKKTPSSPTVSVGDAPLGWDQLGEAKERCGWEEVHVRALAQ